MRSFAYIGIVCLVALAVNARPVWAQQQPPDQQQEPPPDTNAPDNNPTQPIPAIKSPLAGAAGNDQVQTDQGQLQPDTNSITGVQPVGIGAPPMNHNYWAPRFSIAGTADSNPNVEAGSSGWAGWLSIYGGVDVHRASEGNDLLLSYTGGGMFTNAADTDSGVIQTLSLKDKISFHRSNFTIFEQLSYLPESSFGFAGSAGSGIPGLGGVTGVGNGYTPGQSLLVPRGQNLTDSTAVEWDYRLTPRASITAVGSYALLHYFENDLANYGDASFQAGYNYQLTRFDTIAVSYQFSAIRYSNLGQSINSSTVQGVYSRRITGKLGFQIGVGPEFVTSSSPITGLPRTPTSTSISSTYLSVNASVTYALKNVTLTGNYNHGVTGGSGVLIGAETDILTGSISDRISRATTVGATFGYGRNNGFAVGDATESQTYNYWFAGANLTRTLGRSVDVFGNYQFQYQNQNIDTSACVGAACAENFTRNQFSVGVNFHKQPIPF
jgi:hypothetical protein